MIIVLTLIAVKGPSTGQSGIVGNIVRHYIEETSASIIPIETNLQLTDIKSLMGGGASAISPTVALSTIYEGQGGTGEDVSLETYAIQDSSVQAINSVSTDYLNDIKPNKVIEYTIQPGDALSFIASDYGVSVNDLIWANNLKNADSIKPDQIIRIPPVSGVIHKVKKGDTVSSIAKKYGVDSEKVKSFNRLSEADNLNIDDEIIVPGGKIMTQYIAKNQTTAAAIFAHLPDLGDYFMLPTRGRISQGLHGRNGVDIAAACNTNIFADADGVATTVDDTGYNGGFGKLIKISHSNGTETLFGHASKLLITAGQAVVKGQLIALMGSTGRSTGCHLHWEIHGAKHPLSNFKAGSVL
ncbi:MAG: M23 family metallopeptidase [Patescibacteria group bacterium]